MTATDILPPVDACPVCFPGDHPACLPLAHLELTDGTIGAYWCGVCGTGWATRFDRHGWPVVRATAPPVPQDAARREAA